MQIKILSSSRKARQKNINGLINADSSNMSNPICPSKHIIIDIQN